MVILPKDAEGIVGRKWKQKDCMEKECAIWIPEIKKCSFVVVGYPKSYMWAVEKP
jgi:hypothetical protein